MKFMANFYNFHFLINFIISLSIINIYLLLNKKIGTIYYMAPEIFKKKYDYKVDVWACGNHS